MDSWQIFSIGFAAQCLFSGRLLFQWLLSEKEQNVLTPSLFWKMSLAGSILLFLYGYFRSDFAIMLGQVLTYGIYIRNMQLQGEWKKLSLTFRKLLLFLPPILLLWFLLNNKIDFQNLLLAEIPLWLVIFGILGQIIFTLRFVYQWLYSEKAGESSLPLQFWVLSCFGSGIILIYALFRMDFVLLVGHFFGSIIYLRNIKLN